MGPQDAKTWTQLLADNPLAIIVVALAIAVIFMARYIMKLTNDRIEREKEISNLLMDHANKFRESMELARRNNQ